MQGLFAERHLFVCVSLIYCSSSRIAYGNVPVKIPHKANHMKRTFLAVITLVALSCRLAMAQNLLSNPSFELGNVSFTSGYSYTPAVNTTEGQYAVVSNPYLWNPYGYSMTDHTSGSGLMLVLNGSPSASDVVWQETVSVQPNTVYSFSNWEASWGELGGAGYDPTPATLQISINGIQLGTSSPPSTDGVWSQFGLQWYSGSDTQATIEINDLNTATYGNDFALDDMSFSVVPEPSSLLLVVGFGFVLLARMLWRNLCSHARS